MSMSRETETLGGYTDAVGEREKIPFYGSNAGKYGFVTLFVELAEVCIARGLHPINRHPQPLHIQIDPEGRWHIWVNATRDPLTFNADDYPGAAGMSGEIRPWRAWANWNGWLWGLLGPTGADDECMAGEMANPERFVTDCRAAVARAQGQTTDGPPSAVQNEPSSTETTT